MGTRLSKGNTHLLYKGTNWSLNMVNPRWRNQEKAFEDMWLKKGKTQTHTDRKGNAGTDRILVKEDKIVLVIIQLASQMYFEKLFQQTGTRSKYSIYCWLCGLELHNYYIWCISDAKLRKILHDSARITFTRYLIYINLSFMLLYKKDRILIFQLSYRLKFLLRNTFRIGYYQFLIVGATD